MKLLMPCLVPKGAHVNDARSPNLPNMDMRLACLTAVETSYMYIHVKNFKTRKLIVLYPSFFDHH